MAIGTKIHTKPCWNCGNTEMIKRQDGHGHGYCECSKCGASNVELPQPGRSPLLSPVEQTKNTLGQNTPRPIRRVKNEKEKK